MLVICIVSIVTHPSFDTSIRMRLRMRSEEGGSHYVALSTDSLVLL